MRNVIMAFMLFIIFPLVSYSPRTEPVKAFQQPVEVKEKYTRDFTTKKFVNTDKRIDLKYNQALMNVRETQQTAERVSDKIDTLQEKLKDKKVLRKLRREIRREAKLANND